MEVIFAMAIITSGIISILSLFSYNLKVETNNKNKLIATYLAQEGIEVVRQVRDNIWFGNLGDGDGEFLDESEFDDDNEVIVGLVDDVNNRDDIRKGWEIINSNPDRIKVFISNNSYVQHRNAGNWALWGWEETGFKRYLEIDNGLDGPALPLPSGCDIINCVRIISHVSFNGVELAEVTAYLYDDWY